MMTLKGISNTFVDDASWNKYTNFIAKTDVIKNYENGRRNFQTAELVLTIINKSYSKKFYTIVPKHGCKVCLIYD